MLSVMNNTDFELDQKRDALELGPHLKPRVSEDAPNVAEIRYNKATTNGFEEMDLDSNGDGAGNSGYEASIRDSESQYDEFAGHSYETGDMVWGKVKSHPWWPGHIYNEAFASPAVRRTKREGDLLVAFYGDSSYGWFDPTELIPFEPNFAEKSRQTNSRPFVKAVEEAVDEACRRHGLGLACRCRNPNSFRPTNVQGYYAVDVADYEPGVFYSLNQISKARASFQPRDSLAFIKQLASMPSVDEHPSLYFIKSKAIISAYRRAVFEEHDDTYAQAFGAPQALQSSCEQSEAKVQHMKDPCRAPLSGPLRIAETLGKKGKNNAGKPVKAKNPAPKDRYLFKRRDEINEMKKHQHQLGQVSSSSTPPLPVNVSLRVIASEDFVLQKRALIPAKVESPNKLEEVPRSNGVDFIAENALRDEGEQRSRPKLEEISGSDAAEVVLPGVVVDNMTHEVEQDSPQSRKGTTAKAKVSKRPFREHGADISSVGEKKKRKKGSDTIPKEDFQVDNQKSDDVSVVGLENTEIGFPQLLSDLQGLALDPFYGVEKNSPARIQQVVLRFRSLVYQKSLVLLPSVDTEPNEALARASTEPNEALARASTEFSDNSQVVKPPKPRVRPDDPTKGGRKQVRPGSDRQEEKAAKRLKKINELKTSIAEKKVIPKMKTLPVEKKMVPSPPPPNPNKPGPASAKSRDPTMLVLKFPSHINLPSGSELKARLARFGPLDHSKTRVFYKSSTCRVVFQYRQDAQAAQTHLMGTSALFGNVRVVCFLREVGVLGMEPESGKVQAEDTHPDTPPPLEDPAVNYGPVTTTTTTTTNTQLKSCLKKLDESGSGSVAGSSGRGTVARVKFMLGGEESVVRVDTNNNNNNNNNGGGSSSSSMDFNSKISQKFVAPLPKTTPNNVNYGSDRYAVSSAIVFEPQPANIDISREMLSLLMRCSDIVANVKGFLGYIPYHPL